MIFGKRDTARVEKIRDTLLKYLRQKELLPTELAYDMGEIVRSCNKLIGCHLDLWPRY
jgi:hypothetical protein